MEYSIMEIPFKTEEEKHYTKQHFLKMVNELFDGKLPSTLQPTDVMQLSDIKRCYYFELMRIENLLRLHQLLNQ